MIQCLMKHFWQSRFHSSAFSGGKNHNISFHKKPLSCHGDLRRQNRRKSARFLFLQTILYYIAFPQKMQISRKKPKTKSRLGLRLKNGTMNMKTCKKENYSPSSTGSPSPEARTSSYFSKIFRCKTSRAS